MDKIYELLPRLTSDEVGELFVYVAKLHLDNRNKELQNDILALFAPEIEMGISYKEIMTTIMKNGWDFSEIITKLNQMVINDELTVLEDKYYLQSDDEVQGLDFNKQNDSETTDSGSDETTDSGSDESDSGSDESDSGIDDSGSQIECPQTTQ